jgi:GGDEF domain-containing protein
MKMKQRRLWLAAALCWFLMISVSVPMNVAPFVYPYVLAWTLLLLLSPAVRRLPLWLLGGSGSAVPAAVAVLAAWPFDIFLLTIVATFISLLIGRALGDAEDAFERAVQFSMHEGLREPIGASHSSLDVELRRARTHQRAVSVLAISAADLSDAEVDRLVEEAVRKNVSHYIQASLASLLSSEMRAFDILAARGDHLVSMLPETGSEKAMEFVGRLRAATREKLGLELKIGVSSFPAQEVTLEALLDRAELEMLAGGGAETEVASEGASERREWPA